MTTPVELPAVKRVATDHGSHIEPSCDTAAPLTQRLAWHAAVVADDTGQEIRLWIDPHTIGRRRYTLALHRPDGSCGSSSGPFDFDHAWTYLNGVRAGIQSCRKA